jgi:hypothetical protein
MTRTQTKVSFRKRENKAVHICNEGDEYINE